MRFKLVESFGVDSKGNTLTTEQEEFFKDSKVRDGSGQLLVCYHGSDNDKRYDTIDTGKSAYSTPSAYFSDSLDFAVSYAQRYGDKGNIYECYLNITNPLIIDAKGTDFYSIPLNDKKVHISDVAKYTYENNYDGAIINNVEEYGGKVVTDFITFTNDQIKLITNQTPTNSSYMNEAVNTSTYYRLELIDAFGDNCGGLFNSKTLWDIIYDEDNEDDFEAQELESLIDKLENAHDVPPQWIPGNVKFAFKETFYNKHKGTINKVQQLLNNFGCRLLINKIYSPNIVFEDDTQIAYSIDDDGAYRKKRLGLE